MNCQKCEWQQKIDDALQDCWLCPDRVEGITQNGLETICADNCKKLAELRDACIKCSNGSITCGVHGIGKGQVSLDATENRSAVDVSSSYGDGNPSEDKKSNATAFKIAADYVRGGKRTQSRCLESVPPGVSDYLEALVNAIAALQIEDLEILHGLLNGMGLTDIASAYGYASKQTAAARYHAAIQRNPWIEHLNLGRIDRKKIKCRSMTWQKWKGQLLTNRKPETDVPND